MDKAFASLGVKIPEILLPSGLVDLKKWSVVACDQYTSQPDYWEAVAREAAGLPSTLNLIFPEIYLKDEDREARIRNINAAMGRYLESGILEPQKPGFILIDRSTRHTASRKGLILAVDLECYDYAPGSRTLIRATEGTVLDRIPPRVKIREKAPIELPHIMLLIDDPEKTLIEKLYEKRDSYSKLYDFELMQNGGHIRGWKLEDGESLSLVAAALAGLAQGPTPLLFAAGDGNHSLATAKAHWENVRAGLEPQAVANHPARYALVEVVNVHDDGLVFEPIHRVLFRVRGAEVLDNIARICKGNSRAHYKLYASKDDMESSLNKIKGRRDIHHLPFILEGEFGLITVEGPACNLEVGTLQGFLDELLKEKSHIEADYIHGAEVVTELGSRKGCMGFYLPVMDKRDLFRTVILDGVLPRKTFSMGEADEKRYYLECRRIR